MILRPLILILDLTGNMQPVLSQVDYLANLLSILMLLGMHNYKFYKVFCIKLTILGVLDGAFVTLKGLTDGV